MKKMVLLIILITNLLALVSAKSNSEEETSEKNIVLTGKMIFKQKELLPIKFYLEDKLNGNYSLTLLQENINNADLLIQKGSIINTTLKLRIWSRLNSCQFKNENNINYLIINISNEELKDMNHFEILFLGIKTIIEIERKTGCSINAQLK